MWRRNVRLLLEPVNITRHLLSITALIQTLLEHLPSVTIAVIPQTVTVIQNLKAPDWIQVGECSRIFENRNKLYLFLNSFNHNYYLAMSLLIIHDYYIILVSMCSYHGK